MLFILGRPGAGELKPPRSPTSCGSLPPKGAVTGLGRPGAGESAFEYSQSAGNEARIGPVARMQ